MSRLMIPVAVLLFAAGCTHGHLASPRIQSQNLADIYQQQVLDNLAMLIENSPAMPHAAPQQAGHSHGLAAAQQSDPRSIVASTASTADDQRANIELASHQQNIPTSQEKFAAIPAPNYRSMYADRHAHQHSTVQPAQTTEESALPQTSPAVPPKCGCKKCVAQRSSIVPAVQDAAQSGKTSNQACWYASGKPKDVPENYDGKVGRYGKTCVWVSTSGRAQFNQLVTNVMQRTQTAPGTSPSPEDAVVAQAKPAAAPASYRVVAASIALDRDPLAAARVTRSSADSSHSVSRPKSILEGKPEGEPVQELAGENDSLEFDRELSLQALSSWESNDAGEDTADTSPNTGTARVAELGIQSLR